MTKTKFAALLLLSGLATSAMAQECSDKNWKACKGKPWIIGNSMDTPLGDKWWPSRWGAGDEAGSTNWYKKPEVVQRALVRFVREQAVELPLLLKPRHTVGNEVLHHASPE